MGQALAVCLANPGQSSATGLTGLTDDLFNIIKTEGRTFVTFNDTVRFMKALGDRHPNQKGNVNAELATIFEELFEDLDDEQCTREQ